MTDLFDASEARVRAPDSRGGDDRQRAVLALLASLRSKRAAVDPGRECDSGDFIRYLNGLLLLGDLACLDAPVWLNWDITQRCNCRCIHCAASALFDPEGTGTDPLGTREAFRLIDQITAAEVLEVVLSGGEPFLRRDLYDILARLKAHGCFVTILTNGSVPIDIAKLETLLDESTDLLQISLDGANAASHDGMRRAEVFESVVRTIGRLAQSRVPLKVNMVLTPTTLDQVLPVYELTRDLGVKTLSFTCTVPVGRGETIGVLDPRDCLELSLKLHELETSGEGPAIRNNVLLTPYALEEVRALVPPAQHRPFPRLRCLAGTTKAVVDTRGDLYPCPFLLYPEFNAGNVMSEGLAEVWRRGRGWEGLRGGRSFEGTKCSECSYLNLCRGECAGAAYGAFRTLNAPDPRCTWKP